jgi:hypothetical protein
MHDLHVTALQMGEAVARAALPVVHPVTHPAEPLRAPYPDFAWLVFYASSGIESRSELYTCGGGLPVLRWRWVPEALPGPARYPSPSRP